MVSLDVTKKTDTSIAVQQDRLLPLQYKGCMDSCTTLYNKWYTVMPRYNQLYLSVMLFMFVGLSHIVLKIISLMKHVNPVAFSTFDNYVVYQV